MRPSRGITLVELIVTVAITSLTLLGIVRVTQILTNLSGSNQDTQLMQDDATIFLTRLCTAIKKTGDGLQGNPNPAAGQTLLALPDNPLINISPRIIFLSKDNPPVGTMGPEDFWTVFTTATQNGRSGILEQVHRTDNWLGIKTSTANLVQSTFLATQQGVTVSTISFTFYDGQYPPQVANQSPQAASAVRIAIHLKTARSSVTREQTVNLDNLIYGPN